MGLGNSTHAIYLQIVDGKIARRRPAPIAGVTKERQTSTGKIVYEEIFDHVSGFITDIQIVPAKQGFEKFGDSLVVKIVDGEESFMLQMQKDGGYATTLFRILPNIDFAKRTTIIPNMKMDGEKKKVTLFVNQAGVTGSIKHYFTKDNPNGMPGLVKVTIRGKEEWDNTDMMKFFTDILNNKIIPKIHNAAKSLPSLPGKMADETADKKVDNSALSVTDAEYVDDLPF